MRSWCRRRAAGDADCGCGGVLGDALAVVTGRPLEQVDALLPGVPYAAAGEHGGAIRYERPARAVERPALPDLPEDWLDEMAAGLVAEHPGAAARA